MIRPLLCSLTLCLLPMLAKAQEPVKITTVEGITEYRLANGCKVLLYPDPSRNTVTVAMTVFVGSRHEGYGETGMAHLLEHMVFKGTPRNPNVPKALQNHGANFNGTTNVDRTNYFETMTATDENLEFGIQLEADRLVNSYIKREDLMSEFSVVRSEFESGENSPTRILNQRMMAAAFEWHNYGKSTIGNRTDIERVPVDNLREFYRKFYQPDNCMVVVAGKFDEAKALILVQKHFGSIPKPTRQLPRTYTEEPPQDGERLVTLRRVGDVGALGVMYHIPAGRHPDFPALEVLAGTMSAQPTGILYKRLVETKLATTAGGFAMGLHDPGVIEFSAQVEKGVDIDKVKQVLLDCIEEVAANGVPAEDINRTKTRILKNRENAAANTSGIAIGLSSWAAQGDWRLYFLHRDRIEKVTPEDVKQVAARYFKQDNRTVGQFIPTKEPQRAMIAAAPEAGELVKDYKGRAEVAKGEAFNATPGNIDSRTRQIELAGGAKAAILNKKNKGEQVSALITIRYGNEENLLGMEQAAGILPSLMMRGTRKLSFQQLQDEMNKLGVTIGSGMMGGGRRGGGGGGGGAGSLGSLTFSIQAKKGTLAPALDLLKQILREPLLPEKEFDTMVRTRLAAATEMRNEPRALVQTQLSRMLSGFPPGSIHYVPTVDEQIERIQKVKIDQVRQLHEEYLGAENATAVIVGDCDEEAAVKKLNELFDGWKASKPYARIRRPFTPLKDQLVEKIITPDKANAVFAAGINVPLRDDDADYPALMMANFIFGGNTLSSRIGDRIRGKEGLSYGITSSLNVDAIEKQGTFMIMGICNPNNMVKLEQSVREELDKMCKEGVSEKELDEARQGWLNAQMARFVQDNAIAGALSSNLQTKRTMAHYSELESKVRSLTADQIGSTFKKYIDPRKLQMVEGGDFK
ncbi:MAG: pitrilysin family protein [Gemmatales bacterium]